MTENHNSKYKFKEHIFNLSHNKNNYDDALKEWEQMPELYKKLHKGSCKCICQHILKYYYFIHNKKTHNTITVGKECYKKFKFNNINRDSNEIYQNIINKYLQGEYENIEDVDDFSIIIEEEIEKDLKYRYESNITNINVLNYLKTNIIELIENYNFTCLEELKQLVIETINVIEKEKAEKEKIKQKQEEERKKIIEEDNKIKEEKYRLLQKEKIRKDKEKIFNKNKFNELDKKSLMYFKNNIEDLEFYIRCKLYHKVFDFTLQTEDNDNIISTFAKFYKNKVLLYNINKIEFIGLFVDVTDTNKYSRKDILNHKDVIKIDSKKETIGIIMDILNNIS